MPLLNYTTEIPASRSRGEIIEILERAGASAIGLEYAGDRSVDAIKFVLDTKQFGRVPYVMPANVGAVILTLNAEIERETAMLRQRTILKRRIPTNLHNNKEQAERIAWRIAKDWLEAQIALTQIGGAQIEQVMLPYADMGGGRTFFHALVERGSLALPAPSKEEPINVTEISP
jgi:hypothetical protein